MGRLEGLGILLQLMFRHTGSIGIPGGCDTVLTLLVWSLVGSPRPSAHFCCLSGRAASSSCNQCIMQI